jgi:hypothetical protein
MTVLMPVTRPAEPPENPAGGEPGWPSAGWFQST